jgi:hypothetical protein
MYVEADTKLFVQHKRRRPVAVGKFLYSGGVARQWERVSDMY